MADRKQSQDWTSGSALGEGPFREGLTDSPPSAWLAVVLMVVGFGLVGLGVVLLDVSTPAALVAFVVGAIVGVAGVVSGVRGRLMDNVE